MIPVILRLAVLVSATGEVEANPGINLILTADFLVAVVGIDLDSLALLAMVGAKLVIEHSIPVETDALLLGCVGELEELLLGAPFGGDGALLVELAQIVQIIDVVAITFRARGLASEVVKFVSGTQGHG